MTTESRIEHYKPCALIPVYNHWQVLEKTVQASLSVDLPVVLVDDGSNHQCREVMEALSRDFRDVHLVRRSKNGGKGAAVKDGLRAAQALHFTHALQIDADGQPATSPALCKPHRLIPMRWWPAIRCLMHRSPGTAITPAISPMYGCGSIPCLRLSGIQCAVFVSIHWRKAVH